MRWPFGLFGRSRQETSEAGPEAGAAPPPGAPGRDWEALPAIQRAAGTLELTAPARAFAAGLAGSVGVPLALQPLGHARSPEAPAGLVMGLAVPPQTYAGREPLVLQRRPARRQGLTWPAWDVAEEAPAAEPAAGLEPPPPAVGDTGKGALEAPARPAATVAAAPAPVVSLPPPAEPRPVAAVAAVPRPAPLTVSRLPEVVAPAPAAAAGSRAATSPEPAPAADLPLPPAEPLRRLNVGQSRRLGLGPPLPRPSVAPSTLEGGGGSTEGDASGDGPLAPAEAVAPPVSGQPGLPVQPRLVAATSPPSPPASPVEPAASPLPRVQPGPPVSPPGVQEPVTEPVRPLYRVQRRPADPAPAPPAVPPTAPLAGGLEAPAVAAPEAEPAGPPPPEMLPVVVAQRAPAGAPPQADLVLEPVFPSPLEGEGQGGGYASAAVRMVPPSPTLPLKGGGSSAGGRSPGGSSVGGSFATAPVVVSRSLAPAPQPELTLLPAGRDYGRAHVEAAAAGWSLMAPAPVEAPARPMVQAFPEPAAGPPPAVARLPEAAIGHLPAAAVPAELPVQRAEGEAAGPAGGAAGGGHSDRELDDLARQLYDRLRTRLRQELLVDRERAGLITDLR